MLSLVFVVWCSSSWAAPFDSGGWKRFREIHLPPGPQGGLAAISLDASLLDECRPDLSDLRIVSSHGETVPLTITDPVERDDADGFSVKFKVTRRPGKWTEIAIDKSAKVVSRGLLIQTSSRNFTRRVEIRGSDTGREAYVVLMDGLVFDVTKPTPLRSLEVLHPVNNFQYLFVRIMDETQAPLKIDGVSCLPPASNDALTRPLETRVIESRTSPAERSSILIVDLGERRIPVGELRILPPGIEFIKRVRLSRSSSLAPDSWSPFHEGTIFRIRREDAAKEQLSLKFKPILSRYVMIEVSGDGPVLALDRVEAIGSLRLAIFPHEPGVSYRLFYDNPEAKPEVSVAPAQSMNLTQLAADSAHITLGEDQKNVATPQRKVTAPPPEPKPTRFRNVVGIALLLVGLLLLFLIMLRARSLRNADRRRNTRFVRPERF